MECLPGFLYSASSLFPSWSGQGLISTPVFPFIRTRIMKQSACQASCTLLPACFLPGRAKDLSAPRYSSYGNVNKFDKFHVHQYIACRFSAAFSGGLSGLQPAWPTSDCDVAGVLISNPTTSLSSILKTLFHPAADTDVWSLLRARDRIGGRLR